MGGRGNGDRIRFNVGGKIFETTSTTLANAGRNSMLGALLDDEWNLSQCPQADYFIDRNPKCFSILLDLLRTGELLVPPNVSEKMLYREAMYYGLLDHVRARSRGPFDGNCVRLAGSVSGRAPGDGTAVRAGLDGGCCVAHGSMVHVYDRVLDEHMPISLDYQQVNDVGYVDSQNIVVAARQSELGKADGGMGLFSSSSGELRHRFRVSHGKQFKGFTAGALGFSNQESKIFASCRGMDNEYGIGVWDQFTGDQLDFFYDLPGCPLGNAAKLQWLEDGNCLMVATLFPRIDYCYIELLDFRAKEVTWSWSDKWTTMKSPEKKRVLHAIAMEDSHSICVVNQYGELGFLDIRSNLGFLDIRSNGAGVRWSSRSTLMKGKARDDESCYPKLATHNGQLFSSFNDSISVFCGPEWVLTSKLRRSAGGPICDFSIGGDRLFALHSDENVLDVWETLRSPIDY